MANTGISLSARTCARRRATVLCLSRNSLITAFILAILSLNAKKIERVRPESLIPQNASVRNKKKYKSNERGVKEGNGGGHESRRSRNGRILSHK